MLQISRPFLCGTGSLENDLGPLHMGSRNLCKPCSYRGPTFCPKPWTLQSPPSLEGLSPGPLCRCSACLRQEQWGGSPWTAPASGTGASGLLYLYIYLSIDLCIYVHVRITYMYICTHYLCVCIRTQMHMYNLPMHTYIHSRIHTCYRGLNKKVPVMIV